MNNLRYGVNNIAQASKGMCIPREALERSVKAMRCAALGEGSILYNIFSIQEISKLNNTFDVTILYKNSNFNL